jgi:hypothetical protein
MRPRAVASIGLVVVAVATLAAAWWSDPAALTASEAVEAVEGALADAGLDATVEADPTSDTYRSRTREAIDVWAVRATVRSEPIELRVARVGADPVAIDDRNPDGTSYVLSDHEYQTVASHVEDVARSRRLRRNVALTVGALLVVGLALRHATLATREEPA